MHPELLQHTGAEPRWSFSSSAVLHVLAVLVVVGASYMVIEAVHDPRTPIEFADFAAPPSPPPPPPPPAGSASPEVRIDKRMEQPPEEIVQPQALPEEVLVPLEDASSSGVEGGEPGGVPGGVPGGDPNGIPGGEPGSGRLPGVSNGDGSFAPIVITPDMVPPVLITKVEPEYPDIARVAHLGGRVILQAVIDERGGVSELTVLGSSNPLFESASTDAVRQWRYKPALQNGRPVPVYFTVVVQFELR